MQHTADFIGVCKKLLNDFFIDEPQATGNLRLGF